MVALAGTVFGFSFAAYGAALVPYLLILFIFGIALGIMAVALVLRLGPAAEWFIWPIPAAIAPFVGVFYPLSTLPAWMRAASRLLPPSYVFEAMRGAVLGGPVSMKALVPPLLRPHGPARSLQRRERELTFHSSDTTS